MNRISLVFHYYCNVLEINCPKSLIKFVMRFYVPVNPLEYE